MQLHTKRTHSDQPYVHECHVYSSICARNASLPSDPLDEPIYLREGPDCPGNREGSFPFCINCQSRPYSGIHGIHPRHTGPACNEGPEGVAALLAQIIASNLPPGHVGAVWYPSPPLPHRGPHLPFEILEADFHTHQRRSPRRGDNADYAIHRVPDDEPVVLAEVLAGVVEVPSPLILALSRLQLREENPTPIQVGAPGHYHRGSAFAQRVDGEPKSLLERAPDVACAASHQGRQFLGSVTRTKHDDGPAGLPPRYHGYSGDQNCRHHPSPDD